MAQTIAAATSPNLSVLPANSTINHQITIHRRRRLSQAELLSSDFTCAVTCRRAHALAAVDPIEYPYSVHQIRPPLPSDHGLVIPCRRIAHPQSTTGSSVRSHKQHRHCSLNSRAFSSAVPSRGHPTQTRRRATVRLLHRETLPLDLCSITAT
ncbi:hypothetical protein M0R45_025411 [Rubus argutus]|uniref:Uncharacterized protein n=1 Tax=Rubus argutus TaxID=59490 RepID=A0AAW1WTX7_RUBAR